jgi:hypothetical protein
MVLDVAATEPAGGVHWAKKRTVRLKNRTAKKVDFMLVFFSKLEKLPPIYKQYFDFNIQFYNVIPNRHLTVL